MSELTKQILPILRSTRDISLPSWGTIEARLQKTKSATDLVTDIDYKIEELLAKNLLKVDSTISFVGEEFGGDRSANRFWLVDPIDGTSHYVRGLPFCTTMIALIENGQVTFSAIYDFLNDRMYHAERGKGAYCNNEPIFVSTRPLSMAYISFEGKLESDEDKKIHAQLLEQTRLVGMLGSGWEFAMVASGKLEGRVCIDSYGKDYDFAPGSLLVSEAGGIVTNTGSPSYNYTNLNLIAASKVTYQALTTGPNRIVGL